MLLLDEVVRNPRRIAEAPEVDSKVRIDVALARMQSAQASSLAVVRRGRFVGTVRRDDLVALVRAEQLGWTFE